jgi:hypothetical protein
MCNDFWVDLLIDFDLVVELFGLHPVTTDYSPLTNRLLHP